MSAVNLSPQAAQRMNVFTKKVGRGINRHRMIDPGEEILISVSGGKDSLALCLALARRRAWVPMDYRLRGLFIDWREYPAGREDRSRLLEFLDGLDIPCRIVQASIFPRSYDKPFNCYICSRNRKRILFQEAESLGISKIAVGHHLDDIIETTLMNLFFKGEIATMLPVQSFFDGHIKIIRPMCEVEERDVLRLMKVYPLPVFDIRCPRKADNQRQFFKDLIKQVKRVNKHAKENLYNAPWRINRDYLP
ncbi:MAG: tRNA 2-thiocytidine biosynthesis protein TtcA [Spirochaetales bacterium]|nr:tRNA 2-thiocytidine biosynthesis protein TtcA [Spirochaetales bacterium]